MPSVYKSAYNDLNGTVSFGGGGGGGGGGSDRENRRSEFARNNSAARNSRGQFDAFNRNDAINVTTAVGGLMGAAGRTVATRATGFGIATISERQR